MGTPAREAVPALMGILQRGERYVQDEAAWALGRIGPEAREAVSVLIHILETSEADTRQTAAWALGCIGPEARDAVPLLQVMLQEDLSTTGRVEAALALWKLTGPAEGVLPVLIEAVRDPDLDVRRLAADALASIGPEAKAAVPSLRQVLDARSPGQVLEPHERDACQAAAEALRRIDPDVAREVLGADQ
jgi:HEAT repeat protein